MDSRPQFLIVSSRPLRYRKSEAAPPTRSFPQSQIPCTQSTALPEILVGTSLIQVRDDALRLPEIRTGTALLSHADKPPFHEENRPETP